MYTEAELAIENGNQIVEDERNLGQWDLDYLGKWEARCLGCSECKGGAIYPCPSQSYYSEICPTCGGSGKLILGKADCE